MFTISWFYLYGVGGTFYALGTWVCAKSGALDFNEKRDRKMYFTVTGCLLLIAAAHALFQFVLPHVG